MLAEHDRIVLPDDLADSDLKMGEARTIVCAPQLTEKLRSL